MPRLRNVAAMLCFFSMISTTDSLFGWLTRQADNSGENMHNAVSKSVNSVVFAYLFLTLTIVLVLSIPLSGWTTEANKIELSPEEQVWLDNKYTVSVRVGDAPPWEINAPEPQGMSVDYLTIIGKQFGIAFNFIPGTEAWIDGFKDIPQSKKTAIQNKYVPVRFEHGIRPMDVFRWIVEVAGVLLSIIAIILFWNRRLDDDIADRKKIERELQTSEAKFRALFDSAPIPVGYVSNTGTVIDINAKFTQVFGYTKSDIPTAEEWSTLAYPEPVYRRRVIERRETALKKSRDNGVDIGPIEYQVTCKNGEVKQVFTSYTTLQDSFLTAFVDISDLRRAEEAERRSNTLYREITKISGEGVNIADLDGNYVSVNPAFCRMTGYSEAELLGMNVKDLVPNGVKMSLFPKVLRGEQGRGEGELVRKDGSRFVAEMLGYPLSIENQKLAFANTRDITERIQAEKQIKASLKEKEVLLREIHHRVKNNLAVIISLLNLQAYQLKDEHIATALQDSRDRVKSMALIHETLYQSEDIAEISLKEYAPNLGNRLLQAMKGKTGQVQMVYEIEDIRLDIDHAIPCGLILNELITNALKYAFPENDGEVSIAAHYIETDVIELAVKDNGVGLPEGFDTENLESLGLNIVWTLAVNQLEGTFDIRNKDGAIFTIRWPFPTNNRVKNNG